MKETGEAHDLKQIKKQLTALLTTHFDARVR